MIRFTQKPDAPANSAAAPAKKAAVRADDAVQLQLDPDAPAEETARAGAKRRPSKTSK